MNAIGRRVVRVVAAVIALATFERSSATAAVPLRYEVRASIDDDHVLRATMRTLVRMGEGEEELALWFYPDRLAVAPSALNEQTARWIYPREIDTSNVEIGDVRVAGRQVSGRWRRYPVGHIRGRDYAGGDYVIPIAPGPRRELEVRVAFSYRLPERYGRLGRVGRRLTLTGPWYPLVLDSDAFRHSAEHDVELRFPDGYDSMSGVTQAGFVPFVAAPELHLYTRQVEGLTLQVRSPSELYEPPPPSAEGIDALEDVVRIDVLTHFEQVLRDVVITMRRSGIPIRRRTLSVSLVPSRTEMAATAPGMVLIADRVYEIFPLDVVSAFHDRAVRRAFFGALLQPLIDRVEPAAARGWSEDLRAVLLSDLDDVRKQGEVQTVEDLIGWAGFHPIVDQLLYAPQVAFVDVYFGSVAEPDPYREAPWRARLPTSRGRRILESARDLMEEDEFRSWTRRVLRGVPAGHALQQTSPSAAERLPMWLRAPGLEVNYRLGEMESTQGPEGYTHVIHLHRDGARRLEPVEVAVTDEEDNRVVETWDGVEQSGQVTVETPAALHSVQIDPRRRLPQSPRVADGHPLRDDTNRTPFRPPIFQGFSGSFNATAGQVSAFVDFAIRRRYDLENGVAVLLDYGPRGYGAFIRFLRGIGRKRDTNNRVGLITAGASVDRLVDDFVPGQEGGWRFAGIVNGGYSTRRYFLDPRDGASFGASFRAAVTRRDSGLLTFTLSPGFRGNLTVPLGIRGALLVSGGASWVFGDPLSSEMPSLGGRFTLAGYPADEVVGRGIVYAATEARFTPTALSDLQINMLHLVWVREIQLAAFARAGAAFFALDGRDVAPATELGAGIRIHFEYGGVQPAVMVVDVSVPMVRTYEARRTRSPIALLIAFEQYY